MCQLSGRAPVWGRQASTARRAEPRRLQVRSRNLYLDEKVKGIEMAFYELRQYKILEGKMDDWLRLMEEQIIPFQISKGMVITGSWRGEADESIYIWLRRFESEEERERLYEAVYQSDHWKDSIGPRIPEVMDRSAIQVTRLVPTRRSTVQ